MNIPNPPKLNAQGIPIATDPRLPIPIQVPVAVGLSGPGSPHPMQPPRSSLQRGVTDAQGTKRSATAEDERPDFVSKRARNQSANIIHSSAQTPSPPPSKYTRSTAIDFMAECTANGISLYETPPPTSTTSTTDLVSRQPTSTALGPPVPLEAIELLQKSTSSILMALIDKGAIDREDRLLVAVGTIRMCLDVHFVPLMAAWGEVMNSVSMHAGKKIGPVEKLSSPAPDVERSVHTQSSEQNSVCDETLRFSRDILRVQLASAKLKTERDQRDLESKIVLIARLEKTIEMYRHDTDLKDEEMARLKSVLAEKDNGIAEWRHETLTKPMTALQRIEHQLDNLKKPKRSGASGHKSIPELEQRIRNQTVSLRSLEERNKKLVMQVERTQMELAKERGAGKEREKFREDERAQERKKENTREREREGERQREITRIREREREREKAYHRSDCNCREEGEILEPTLLRAGEDHKPFDIEVKKEMVSDQASRKVAWENQGRVQPSHLIGTAVVSNNEGAKSNSLYTGPPVRPTAVVSKITINPNPQPGIHGDRDGTAIASSKDTGKSIGLVSGPIPIGPRSTLANPLPQTPHQASLGLDRNSD